MKTQNISLFELVKRRIYDIEISQVFISICVVLLAIWCAYNIKDIFDKYNQDETIISLENISPGITDFPELFPDTFGKSFNNYSKWRLSHGTEVNSEDKKALEKRTKEFLLYEGLAMQKFTTLQILQNYSVRIEELIPKCEFFPINIRRLHTLNEDYVPSSYKCRSLHPALESIYERKKCFTFFSKMRDKNKNTKDKTAWKKHLTVSTAKPNNLGKPDNQISGNDDCNIQTDKANEDIMKNSSQNMKFDLNPSIEITINNIENDIWFSYLPTTASVLMTVHPPDIAQSRRDFLFFQVTKSTFNEITFTQKTTILLNTQASKCTTYKDNKDYPNMTTRDSCISWCVLTKGQSHNNCVNYFGVLSLIIFQDPKLSGRHICLPEMQKYENYLQSRKECEEKCPQECVKTIFEVSGQMRNTALTATCKTFWWEGMSTVNSKVEGSLNDTETFLPLPDSEMQFNENQLYDKVLPAEVDEINGQESAEMNQFMNTVSQSSKYIRLRHVNNINHRKNVKKLFKNRFKRSFGIRAPFDEEPVVKRGDCKSEVSVRISPKPFTIVKHQKAISQETFIGTIGGHLGIWLGLSLYKIIKFIVHTGYRLLVKIIGDCYKSFNYNMSP